MRPFILMLPWRCSASIASNAFGLPFVSIDRPCYGGTSSFLPSKFGRGCTCVILLCHSLGAMGGIIAAAMRGQGENPLYPLGGLITFGMGDKPPSSTERLGHVLMPLDIKDKVMFRPGTCSPEVLAQSKRLNAATPDAAHVVVPVMFALVDNDPFFEATRAEIRTCMAAFRNSVRLSYWSQGWYSRCFGFAMECSASISFKK
ncbi:hypothetical protein BDW68DRAFT_192980 [Aspergillus falconensis]